MHTVPILQGSREIGTVSVQEEGLYLRFAARTYRCFDGIYRAYLQFENGERLLGVMEPSSSGMRCVRCFAKQQLCGLGALQSVALRTKEEACWQSYDGRLPGTFASQIPKEGAIQCREGDMTLIALPYAVDAPFPLSELFCLASIRHISGNLYVVYRFSKNGTPKI